MGKILKGILGGFSGKVGNMVGSTWKGIDYMRSLPKKMARKASELQVAQQIKFALAVDFTKAISQLVTVGFRGLSKTKVSAYNVAVSQVIREAITGTFPDFAIDYSRVRLSEGSLAPLAGLKLRSDGPNEFTLEWKNNSDEYSASAEDSLTIVIVNPDKDRYICKERVATRAEGSLQESISDNFAGDIVHVYCFFVSKDGKKVSNSVYGLVSLM